ncbi:MAG: 5-oxoprolinase subunit PxpA [Trueperaceae bacterium]
MKQTRTVDLNVDAGESFGSWRMGHDDELFPYMSSANLACGFHAGDPLTIRKTIELAKRHGVQVGAHPALPDLVGFGRRQIEASPDEVHADVLYQLGAMGGMLRAQQMQLRHVSPHGALGWMTWNHEPTARAFLRAMRDFDPGLSLVVLGGTVIEDIARKDGVRVVLLGFPERGYLSNGRLAPRTSEGAVITDADQAAERAVKMVTQGLVQTVEGESIEVEVDSLLIHGDNPAAPLIARKVHEAVTAAGVEVRAF